MDKDDRIRELESALEEQIFVSEKLRESHKKICEALVVLNNSLKKEVEELKATIKKLQV